MAGLAADAKLARHNSVVASHPQRAGRMTREAAQDGRVRIKDAVAYTGFIGMSRCARVAVNRAIPALTLLQILLAIQSADERNRLDARAERPFARLRLLTTR
jgi:hypothetical protein